MRDLSKSLVLSVWVNRLFMAALAAAIVFLPTLLRLYLDFSSRSMDVFPAILTVLYVAALPAFGILISLERLLHNIRRDEVFLLVNVRYLRFISWCCAAVSAAFFILGVAHLFALLIAVAAAFFMLILRVLGNVLAQAVMIKHENDFTI